MKTIIGILILVVYSFVGLTAQELKPKEHVELGEELMNKGAYLEAAEHFKAAWEQKKKKEELISMAGKAYEMAMDYENAAFAYEQLLDEKKYPDAKLNLAKMLKQSGNYTRANKLFLDYLYDYEEDDKREVEQQVQRQIRGCELGIQLLQGGGTKEISLEALGEAVNSPGQETNPIPFDQKVLYYTSDFTGKNQVYRTEKDENGWSKGIVPPLFPDMDSLNISNGAFSPDFKRFYFNQCETPGNGLTGDQKCALYYILRKEDTWSDPIRMKDYINVNGTSNTHPYVVYLDDKEIIYFSSDRSGGHGGKDLWYIVRDFSSDISEYTFPTNLGKNINSSGDEIAPFFSVVEGSLYFSSDGRTSIGGFDIFKSKGSEAFWENAENVGLPFNSPAEDFQYRTNSKGSMGYLVSNRKYQGESNTTDFDIFGFVDEAFTGPPVLSGTVLNEANETALSNVILRLLKKDGGEYRMTKELNSEDGQYSFELEAGSNYKVLAQKEGFMPTEMTLKASSFADVMKLEKNLTLLKKQATNKQMAGKDAPSEGTDTPTEEVVQEAVSSKMADEKAGGQPEQSEPVNGGKNEKEVMPVDNKTVKITEARKKKDVTQPQKKEEQVQPSTEEIVNARAVNKKQAAVVRNEQKEAKSDASEASPVKRLEGGDLTGVYYKVQICSVGEFDPNNAAFDNVRYLGNLDTEFLPSKNMTRVLLGSYRNRKDAENVGQNARKSGFPGAFVVQYKDGQRLNR